MTISEYIQHSNLRSVWIVDDDEVMLQLMENYCESFGFEKENMTLFTDGNDVWDKVSKGFRCDLLILDWKLKGMSGLCLFNKLRANPKFAGTPILVVSGLLQKDDFALLAEFPSTSLLEKPFTQKTLEPKLLDLLLESNYFNRASKKLKMIISDADAGKAESSKAGMLKLLSNAPNPIPIAIQASRALRSSDHHDYARAIIEPLAKINPQNIALLSELAKILFASGKIKQAKFILDSTIKVSPDNLERLCFAGQVEINLNSPTAARKHFKNALQIDPTNREAQHGTQLADGLAGSSGLGEEQVAHRLASTLNVLAIAKVRSGDFSAGQEQYQAAISLLTNDSIAAKLSFNMGLGFLRNKQYEKALERFKDSVELSNGHFAKAQGYVTRIEAKIAGKYSETVIDGQAQGDHFIPSMDMEADLGIELDGAFDLTDIDDAELLGGDDEPALTSDAIGLEDFDMGTNEDEEDFEEESVAAGQ